MDVAADDSIDIDIDDEVIIESMKSVQSLLLPESKQVPEASIQIEEQDVQIILNQKQEIVCNKSHFKLSQIPDKCVNIRYGIQKILEEL